MSRFTRYNAPRYSRSFTPDRALEDEIICWICGKTERGGVGSVFVGAFLGRPHDRYCQRCSGAVKEIVTATIDGMRAELRVPSRVNKAQSIP